MVSWPKRLSDNTFFRTETDRTSQALPTPTSAPALTIKHVERIGRAVDASHSPATLRAYGSAWRAFTAWTEAEGLPELPAAPETVAAYLTHRAEAGASCATLMVACAAIAFAHRRAGHANPCDHEGVKAAQLPPPQSTSGPPLPSRTSSRGCGGSEFWCLPGGGGRLRPPAAPVPLG